jgi:uncharacterized membrane protein
MSSRNITTVRSDAARAGTLDGAAERGSRSERSSPIVHDVATTIQRPVDDVASYLFDPRTMPQWSAVLTAVEDPDDRSVITRGRRLSANLQILGVTATVDGRMLDMDLESRRGRLRLEFRDSDGRIDHELELDDVDDRTVVHLRNRVVPPPWLAATVGGATIRRYVEETADFALAMIKAILEAHQEGNVAAAAHRAAETLAEPAELGQPRG